MPAIESAHALAYVIQNASKFQNGDTILINLSGRGDKDMEIYCKIMEEENG